MSTPVSGKLILSTAVLFALSAIPAFANHGGGGGGGGFHGGGGGGFHGGGGGFHGGGGGGFRGSSGGFRGGPSGGGRSYSAPAAGYGSRGYAPSTRSYSGAGPRAGYGSRQGYGESRPGGNMAAGGQRFGNSSSARPGVADGQWHSFGNGPANRAASSGPAGGAGGNNGGVHVFNGNRVAPGTSRSFSGQGGEVWENAPASRNVISRSQSLSAIHNSFGGSASSSPFRGSAGFSGSSRFASGSPLLARNGFGGGATNSVPQLRGSLGFNGFGGSPFGRPFGRPLGHPFGGFGRGGFGRGCWNCGFGLGFGFGGWGWGGWGWGGPWLGFGWDPFWVDPWWGWPAYGYGSYIYAPTYSYPDSGYNAPEDDYNPPPPQDDNQPYSYNEGPANGNWVTPNGPSPAQVPSAQAFSVPILIYMKNGSVLTVRDYWMVDGELHYLSMNGTERTADLEAVDLPRTNSENAKSGVKFIFKSEPSVVAPAPDGGSGSAPSAQPNAAPAPQQMNVAPQSESRI